MNYTDMQYGVDHRDWVPEYTECEEEIDYIAKANEYGNWLDFDLYLDNPFFEFANNIITLNEMLDRLVDPTDLESVKIIENAKKIAGDKLNNYFWEIEYDN